MNTNPSDTTRHVWNQVLAMAQERTAALEECDQARAEREIMSIVDHRPRWDGEGTWVK